jgi:acyl-CoA synthetase (AMP-forming)/AMP-acid ligase II
MEGGSIWECMVDRARATPDKVMLLDGDERAMTFAEYADRAERAAAGLYEWGVRPGDTIAWQMPTWIETVVLVGALCRLGVRQVPLLPIYRERELSFILRQCGARAFIVPGVWRGNDYAATAERLADELGSFRVLVCDREVPDGDAATLPAVAYPVAEIRWVFYTSGTTSDPKGVMHVDDAIIAIGSEMTKRQHFAFDDRFGIAFPFTHIGGISNLCVCLDTGCTLVLLEVFEPARAVEVFARVGVTVVGGGPAFYRAFLEQQRLRPSEPILPALRFITGGGAPMPPELHREVRAEIGGLGCANGYGMTEGVIMAINDPTDTDEHLMYTSGQPLGGMEIVARDADGVDLPTDAEGELWIRGVGRFQGYLDESLNDAVFDADGWFRTGDLGRMSADGYATVTGRLKDIIIRKGENISAKEVEDLLYTHPKVANAGVIGVPDAERGEMVVAVVELADPEVPITLEEIAEYFEAAGMMKQKIPERLEFVPTMPRNATGKILKNDLRAQFSR